MRLDSNAAQRMQLLLACRVDEPITTARATQFEIAKLGARHAERWSRAAVEELLMHVLARVEDRSDTGGGQKPWLQ